MIAKSIQWYGPAVGLGDILWDEFGALSVGPSLVGTNRCSLRDP